MINNSSIVDDYFKRVIKKSWTWNRLTEEEREKFINMNVFDQIKGRSETRVEWLNTIYTSFLTALGYEPIGWRETEEEKEMPRF